jgi:hypothetical protein
MRTQAPEGSQRPKAVKTLDLRRGRLCPRCAFCAPSGRCLNPAVKSGRCGDWIWYMRHGKQCRRLWTKVRDPRTPQQRYWRKLLSAASKRYSAGLADKQQDACIAAGAKLRSRTRLGQWGYLTGQQYWVRQECKGKAPGPVPSTKTCTEPLQTKQISASTWEPHRDATVTPPGEHRPAKGIPRPPGRASVLASPSIRRHPGIQGPRVRSPSRRRCSWGDRASRIEAEWRWQRGMVRPERGPPEGHVAPRQAI